MSRTPQAGGKAPLNGSIALVTGASRGLGKGIAVGLGEAGATVYITGRSLTARPDQPGSLEETAAAVTAAGGKAVPVVVDHGDDAQVEALFQRIQQEQGRLDVLVNNAYGGVTAIQQSFGQPFWQGDPALWDASNQVGLRGHYVASVYGARLMVPQRRGLICTLSSWGGLAYIFGVAYGAGKAGCDRLAADMAVELKPHGVTSLSLWPGIVGTELMQDFFSPPDGDANPNSDADANAFAEAMQARFNWETPLLSGRVVAALAADPNLMARTGRVQIAAELARHYGLQDADGARPASLRSLRYVLPAAVPALRARSALVPDWRMPWALLLVMGLASPRR